jgi:hypothetical protein
VLRLAIVVVCVAVFVAAGAVLASAALDEPSREYRNSVVIDAPRHAIWAALTEFERYDEWNPFFRSVSGKASPGESISVTVEMPDGAEETRKGEVLIVRPRRKLEWRTRLFAPGILDREQIFRVLPLSPRRFRVVQERRVEGLLAPLADGHGERAGLVSMLAALERRVESSTR